MYVYVYESMPVKIIDPVSTSGLVFKKAEEKNNNGDQRQVGSAGFDSSGASRECAHMQSLAYTPEASTC